jgi:serine/threonine protein kinase
VGLYDETPLIRDPNEPLPACTKVLKYTSDSNDRDYLTSIKVEARILDILQKLGPHPSIIESEGLNEDGLVLKYYPNGDMKNYLIRYPEVSLEIRLDWCQQLVAAVSFIHSKNVIHCNIDVSNILLDINLNIILSDFQGVLKNNVGERMLDGLSREGSKSSMPRAYPDYAEERTDIFAVGTAMYHTITGSEVYPELDSCQHEVEIQHRFRNAKFPRDNYACSHIIENCWRGLYGSIDEVGEDILQMQSASWDTDVAQKLENGFLL